MYQFETAVEKRELFLSCEKVLKRNFIAIGVSLRQIRDEELWRYARHPEPSQWDSFDEYCQKEHELSKGYVSRLISAAAEAIKLQIRTGISIPSEPVATELRKVSEDDKAVILEKAALRAMQSGRPMTSADIRLSRLEALGTIPDPVKDCASKLGWQDDPDRMDTLLTWYQEGKENSDGKFWSAFHSGALDPADGKPSVILSSASLREIKSVEKRWQKTVMDIQKDEPFYWIGIAADDLELDGAIARIAHRKVKVIILDEGLL